MIDVDKANNYLKECGFTFDHQLNKWDYQDCWYVVEHLHVNTDNQTHYVVLYPEVEDLEEGTKRSSNITRFFTCYGKSEGNLRLCTFDEFKTEIDKFILKYENIKKERLKLKIQHICKEDL